MKTKFPIKKLLILLVNFAISFIFLRGVIELSERLELLWIYFAGLGVFAAATVVLFVAYFVLNGYSFGKELRTADTLPKSWTEEEKSEFLAAQPERKEKAKNLLLFILPLILTLALSYIELYLIG